MIWHREQTPSLFFLLGFTLSQPARSKARAACAPETTGRSPMIVAVLHEQGGVGQTTVTVSFGAALAERAGPCAWSTSTRTLAPDARARV